MKNLNKLLETAEFILMEKDDAFIKFKNVADADITGTHLIRAEEIVWDFLDSHEMDAEPGGVYIYDEDDGFFIGVEIKYFGFKQELADFKTA